MRQITISEFKFDTKRQINFFINHSFSADIMADNNNYDPNGIINDNLDGFLFYLNKETNESISMRQAFEGIFVFGGTGSGKSSGSGRTIALSLLKAGLGGIVLTVKEDECGEWIKYAKLADRENDLVIIGPQTNYPFDKEEYHQTVDLVAFEYLQYGDSPGFKSQLTDILWESSSVNNLSADNSDPFWIEAPKLMLRHAITIAECFADKEEPLTLQSIMDIITNAPVKNADDNESAPLSELLEDLLKNYYDEQNETWDYQQWTENDYAKFESEDALNDNEEDDYDDQEYYDDEDYDDHDYEEEDYDDQEDSEQYDSDEQEEYDEQDDSDEDEDYDDEDYDDEDYDDEDYDDEEYDEEYDSDEEEDPYLSWLEYMSKYHHVNIDWLNKIWSIYSFFNRPDNDEMEAGDAKAALHYWLIEYPSVPRETMQSLLMTIQSRLGYLLLSPFKELFFSESTVDIRSTFGMDENGQPLDDNKIFILNVPQKTYHNTGVTAQTLFKQVWQRAAERRGKAGFPAFLWIDEAQFFITKDDSSFLQTARSSRISTVFLTQTIPNLKRKLGSTDESDTLLSNFQTVIFHANSCPVTNAYAEQLFGKEWATMPSVNASFSAKSSSGASDNASNKSDTVNYNFQELPLYRSQFFTTLKSGGPNNDCKVEAIVYRRAYRKNSPDHTINKSKGTNDIYAVFDQNIK